MKYLDLWFLKSLPWLVIEIHGSKISFYRNIVRQNVLCEYGLRLMIIFESLLNTFESSSIFEAARAIPKIDLSLKQNI